VPSAHGIQVITVTASRIARIVSFNDPGLLTAFGLPQALPSATAVAPEPRP
jgi:hypothetical protein